MAKREYVYRIFKKIDGKKYILIYKDRLTFKEDHPGYAVKKESKIKEMYNSFIKEDKDIEIEKLLKSKLDKIREKYQKNLKKKKDGPKKRGPKPKNPPKEIINDNEEDVLGRKEKMGSKIDPDILFKRGINKKCKECIKKCKQSKVVTILQCPQFKKKG